MSAKWIAADWTAPAGVRAGTTLRVDGVSRAGYRSLNLAQHVGDDSAAVSENRRRFRSSGALPSEPVWLRQVHGNNVAEGAPAEPDPGTDALLVRTPGVVAAVLTADCLPIVFAAGNGGEVAVAHAGWRGLSGGIIEATVSAMRAGPGDIVVWLGPAISQPAFEVGAEVRQRFLSHDTEAGRYFAANERGRYQADLYGLATQRLEKLGVSAIHGGTYCTYGDRDRFYSYRRDGRCGRMATFVYFGA